MHCPICQSHSEYYFSKTYTEPPYDALMRDIGAVDYYKCKHCGFVLSKTHTEISDEQWSTLNSEFHHHHEQTGAAHEINQPPYLDQASMIVLLGRNNVIDTSDMIDYAAGYGCLSNLLNKYHDLKLPIYDPFVRADQADKYIKTEDLKTYKTVINSAMFEHVISRNDLDKVNALVADDGALLIHTVICENIPKDPDWFYLRAPVHTAFHTNKSMQILMQQWRYRSSIYSPFSKTWVLLREDVTAIEKTVKGLNKELQSEWFYCKNGFVDYWKGF